RCSTARPSGGDGKQPVERFARSLVIASAPNPRMASVDLTRTRMDERQRGGRHSTAIRRPEDCFDGLHGLGNDDRGILHPCPHCLLHLGLMFALMESHARCEDASRPVHSRRSTGRSAHDTAMRPRRTSGTDMATMPSLTTVCENTAPVISYTMPAYAHSFSRESRGSTRTTEPGTFR